MTNLLLRRGAVVLVATIAAAGTFLVLHSAADIEVAAHAGNAVQQVTAMAVVVAALIAGLCGWALLAVLERTVSRPRTVWSAIAAVVLLLSLVAGPLGGTTTGAKITLAVLHLVVGVILLIWLPRGREPKRG